MNNIVLKDNKILINEAISFHIRNNKFIISEECEGYYDIYLDVNDLDLFIKELSKMSVKMHKIENKIIDTLLLGANIEGYK
jgi:hypothetical protein